MNDYVVVIATYNEIATIGQILACLAPRRVVVVNDNSPDGTAEEVYRHSNAFLVERSYK